MVTGLYGESVFSFCKKLPNCLPQWLCHIAFPPAMNENFLLFHMNFNSQLFKEYSMFRKIDYRKNGIFTVKLHFHIFSGAGEGP